MPQGSAAHDVGEEHVGSVSGEGDDEVTESRGSLLHMYEKILFTLQDLTNVFSSSAYVLYDTSCCVHTSLAQIHPL